MTNFQGRTQINFTRRSSLSDGWHSASGAYEKGSEKIPFKAWLGAAGFVAFIYVLMAIGEIAGF
jgi:hypothetical protein